MSLIVAVIVSCSAQGMLVQVERLGGGVLRYSAFSIPGDLKQPRVLIDGGAKLRTAAGGPLYRFRQGPFRYDAIPDPGYGRVEIFEKGRPVETKACGDV